MFSVLCSSAGGLFVSYMHRMVCLMLMCYYLINLLSMFMTVPSAEGRQPQASLFDIWAEAIRWEQEGMPGSGKPLCAFCSWCSV